MRSNNEIIKEILRNRGIITDTEIEEFLSSKPTKTYNPFLLDGMREGVDLLLSEIEAGTKICIYGDYDADGVTAVCVMICAIKELTDNWFFYIPSRFEEGYGLNCNAIDRIIEDGAGLILTVDCGCVSCREVEYAKSKGLKLIVTDHHNIENEIADCIVIDPKKPKELRKFIDSDYPCPDLAGCGVAFKFIQAIQRTAKLPKSILNDALDMVAVGTIGDIVNLSDENRTLVKFGIKAANSGHRRSLQTLAKAISLKEINSENIAFGIVPHINASGRMSSASEAVKLFLSEDAKIIEEQTNKLISYNNERKRIQEEAYEDCLNFVNKDENFIVLKMPDMHEGIAGIVAGKIKDKYNRPVIIVTPTDDGDFKGTGRSISGVDIYNVLNNNSELFKRFGGHKSACGFLMEAGNYERLLKGVKEQTDLLFDNDPQLLEKTFNIDTEIETCEVNVALARDLLKLAPFGEGNPSPKFALRNVTIKGVSYMGENKTHARFYVCGDNPGVTYNYVNCVLFRKAKEMTDILTGGEPVDLIGSISYQVWKGKEKTQFMVEEILKCK